MAKSSQEHLREQCGFLKRSVQSVLDGHSEEAVRVATTIRVLVHKTKTATPLLEQLRPDYLPEDYQKYVVDSPMKVVVAGAITDTVHLGQFSTINAAAQICECIERTFAEAIK